MKIKHRICKSSELADNHHKYFSYGIVKGIVLRDAHGLRAFKNFCPHMGGPVKPCGKVLQCDWHGATFDIADGKTQPGCQAPLGTCLAKIEISEIDGEIIAQLELPDDPFA